jgi:hypothetical protein
MQKTAPLAAQSFVAKNRARAPAGLFCGFGGGANFIEFRGKQCMMHRRMQALFCILTKHGRFR